MAALNLEQLKQLRPTIVAVDVDGQPAMVRKFAAGDRDKLTAWFHANKTGDGLMLKNNEFKLQVVALALCDEAGNRLVVDDEGYAALSALAYDVVDALYDAAAKLNGMAPDSADDAAKN